MKLKASRQARGSKKNFPHKSFFGKKYGSPLKCTLTLFTPSGLVLNQLLNYLPQLDTNDSCSTSRQVKVSSMDQILFPRFWKEKPALWFAQVESVFALSGIVSDRDKYDYTITELPSEAIGLVEDIILNPPKDDKYVQLKNEVIKQFSIFNLEKEELGNKSPSEFLQYLSDKADHRVSVQTIRSLWLKGLPKHIREIVSIAATGSIEVLSEMADRMFTIVPGPEFQSGVPNENVAECVSKLNVQIESLRAQVEKLQQVFQCQHCTPCLKCRSQLDMNNNKGLMQSPRKVTTCWYHTNFGDKAVRCEPPCTFKEKSMIQELFNATSF